MATVAVVGSRGFARLSLVRDYIARLAPDTLVVTGGAPGVDQTAEFAAYRCGLRVLVIPADWAQYGRRAGPIRNTEIVDRADRVVAFWDGKSRGTADTIRKARAAGKPVDVIPRALARVG